MQDVHHGGDSHKFKTWLSSHILPPAVRPTVFWLQLSALTPYVGTRLHAPKQAP